MIAGDESFDLTHVGQDGCDLAKIIWSAYPSTAATPTQRRNSTQPDIYSDRRQQDLWISRCEREPGLLVQLGLPFHPPSFSSFLLLLLLPSSSLFRSLLDSLPLQDLFLSAAARPADKTRQYKAMDVDGTLGRGLRDSLVVADLGALDSVKMTGGLDSLWNDLSIASLVTLDDMAAG